MLLKVLLVKVIGHGQVAQSGANHVEVGIAVAFVGCVVPLEPRGTTSISTFRISSIAALALLSSGGWFLRKRSVSRTEPI